MKNIIFNFDDHVVNFDCVKCKATCCHVNNRLIMNERQKDIIVRENPLTKPFILKDSHSNTFGIEVGKKCWFLQEDTYCRLHSKYGADNKPISCTIYPLKVWRVSQNTYFVDYIPCPNFVLTNNIGIKHSSLIEDIKNYIEITDIKPNPYTTDIYSRISFDSLNYYRNKINRELKSMYDESYTEYIDKITFFFRQIILNPISIKSFTNIEELSKTYFEVAILLLENNHKKINNNFQNDYLVLMKHFNKMIIEVADKGGENNE